MSLTLTGLVPVLAMAAASCIAGGLAFAGLRGAGPVAAAFATWALCSFTVVAMWEVASQLGGQVFDSSLFPVFQVVSELIGGVGPLLVIGAALLGRRGE